MQDRKPNQMIQLSEVHIRPEETRDLEAIYDVTQRAFAEMPFADGDEQDLIDRLRTIGALSLSLVAEYENKIVGQLALSPVAHDSSDDGWFGLGPVSVHPDLQKKGIGGLLIGNAVHWMTDRQAQGCILVGDPNYYRRHGFVSAPAGAPENEPAEFFMVLELAGTLQGGRFSFHQAFYQ